MAGLRGRYVNGTVLPAVTVYRLEEHGLMVDMGDGTYSLTPAGERWLSARAREAGVGLFGTPKRQSATTPSASPV